MRLIVGLGVWSLLPPIALAQITPDGSLGTERSQVTRGPVQGSLADLIQGGARRGSNLFHSFSDFNVGDRQRVYFANPAGITNILSRVTGNNPSNILGTLGVNGTANLFLINPNGLLFGPNARLDIRGSFLASTTDSLTFDNGFAFSASNPQAPPVLTVSVPIGLQFGTKPGEIFVRGGRQSDLATGNGQTLSLVGGDVILDGANLSAPGGRIELGGVGKDGFVTITSTRPGWELGYQNVQQFQDIQIPRPARINAGSLPRLPEVNAGGSGGSIQVQGRQIIIAGGAQLITLNRGTQTGKDLIIRGTELVEVSGFHPENGRSTRVATETLPGSIGSAGNLIIETKHLRVTDGAIISASTTGQGNGGGLIVRAQSVELFGLNQATNSSSVLSTQAQSGSLGNAGNLTIETENLHLTDGAVIATGTFSSGNGGHLIVRAQSVTVDGVNPVNGALSSISAQTYVNSTGNAGEITLEVERLNIMNQGEIGTNSEGSGIAGNITIEAKSQITLADDGRIRADTNTGQGNISLTTPLLLMQRGSRITTNAAGIGTGGNITINAGFIVSAANENNDIIANAFEGSGGKITIAAQGIFGFNLRTRLELQRLLNPTNPTQLDPRRLATNDITAFSQASPTIDTGSVTLQTPNLDPAQGLTTLPTDLTDPSQLIAATCPADQGNSFAITGRGGIPEDPRQPLMGQVIWRDERGGKAGAESLGQAEAVGAAREVEEAIIEAQDWVVDRMGAVTLLARNSQASMSLKYPLCAKFPS